MISIHPLLVIARQPTTVLLEGLPPDKDVRIEVVPVRDKATRGIQTGRTNGRGALAIVVEAPLAGQLLFEAFAANSNVAMDQGMGYAIDLSLAGRRVLKCDFHIHTQHSDGRDTVADMVLRGREVGLDVLAIADHNKHHGSREAIDLAERLELGVTCLPGEEISASDWHLLSIGASRRIGVDGTRTKPDGLRPTIDLVHEAGGRAYLAHPFWTWRDTHHLVTSVYDSLLDSGELDGIEVFGDVDWADNMRSLARYHALPPDERPPVIGNSDAHAVDHTLGRYFTLVWARDASQVAVADAIAEGMSVACAVVRDGDDGSARLLPVGGDPLIDVALFLYEHYLPEHDALCAVEASQARAMHEGDGDSAELAAARRSVAAWSQVLEPRQGG